MTGLKLFKVSPILYPGHFLQKTDLVIVWVPAPFQTRLCAMRLSTTIATSKSKFTGKMARVEKRWYCPFLHLETWIRMMFGSCQSYYIVCVCVCFFADCFELECVWIIGKYVWRTCPFMEKRPERYEAWIWPWSFSIRIYSCMWQKKKKVVTRSQDRFWSDGHALLWYQPRALPWRRGTFWTVMTISIAATTGAGWK